MRPAIPFYAVLPTASLWFLHWWCSEVFSPASIPLRSSSSRPSCGRLQQLNELLQVEGHLEEMVGLAKSSEQYKQYMMSSMQDGMGSSPLEPSVEERFRSGQFSATVRELVAYYIAMVSAHQCCPLYHKALPLAMRVATTACWLLSQDSGRTCFQKHKACFPQLACSMNERQRPPWLCTQAELGQQHKLVSAHC